MPHDNEPKFKRYWTKDQSKGRHHLTLTPDLNTPFLEECERERRVPSDLIRIILEDRYASEVHYPKTVEIKPRGVENPRKREVA